MLEIITVLAPIAVMLAIGMWCRRSGFLTQDGIENVKKLVTKVILPVAIFHALSTADYSAETGMVVGLVFAVELTTFGVGFLLRGLLPELYGKYVPFMCSLYEGGMIAYPLFANLYGSENLSRMAMLDIPGLLFGFSIYMGMLQEMESGVKPSAGALLRDAMHNPAFIASALGVACGLAGVTSAIIAGPLGSAYLAAESMVTAPMTGMILLVVGYNLRPEVSDLAPCLKTIALRAAVQACAIGITVIGLKFLMPGDPLLVPAAIIYMSAPVSFSVQSFLRSREGSTYAATVCSLYCILTILVYAGVAVLL